MRTLFNDERESEILRCGLEWLRHHGYVHWRNHVGGIQRSKAGKQLSWSKNPNKGMPDVMTLLKHRTGVLVGIEFKTRTGRVSAEQDRWRTQLVDAGAGFILARSIDDLIRGIRYFEHF